MDPTSADGLVVVLVPSAVVVALAGAWMYRAKKKSQQRNSTDSRPKT